VNVLATLCTAVILFASTNIDALLMLVVFFGSRRFHARSIIAGEFLAGAIVILGSVLCAAASVLISRHALAWLGVVPLALGVWQLVHPVKSELTDLDANLPRHGRNVLLLAMVGLSHSADNVAVYVPYFAASGWNRTLIAVSVFMGMTALWCAVAYSLVRHPLAEKYVRLAGRWVTPLVLILLGLWILSGLLPTA
jgi:cadmium resistance protein CadD (predicted permease)